MARTQEQILAQINEEADRHAALAELQRNTSRVSVWRYIKQTTAFAIRTIEEMLDTHSAEVEARLNRQRIGTPAWYAEQALRYQRGQKVALIDGRPGYATDVPDARIIRHVAVEEATDSDGNKTGIIKVKAVKAGATPGAPYEVLTEEEKKSFQAYLNAITFAGLHVTASSDEAVPVQVTATIQVDAQLIVATGDAAGTSVGGAEKPVEEAIRAYLRDLPFNGVIRRTAIVDAIQEVAGVVDVGITSLQANSTAFTATHKPAAGHASYADGSSLSYQTGLITS